MLRNKCFWRKNFFYRLRMNLINEKPSATKKRHWLASAGLFAIFVCGIISFSREANFNGSLNNSPLFILKAVFSLLKCYSIILIFNWRKLGFWLYLANGFVLMIANLVFWGSFNGVLHEMICIAVLYGALCFKKNDVSAWEQLK